MLLRTFIHWCPSRTLLSHFSLSFPLSFNLRAEIMRRKISYSFHPLNWRDENRSSIKGKTPMAPGSTVSVTYIPWRFHVTKYRKLLCPSSCHITPRTHSFFFFVQFFSLPVVWLSALSAHSLAPALMFLISLI